MSKSLQHFSFNRGAGRMFRPSSKEPAQRLARTLLLTATTLSEWARPDEQYSSLDISYRCTAGASGPTFSVNCNVERLAGFADFWRSRVSAQDTPAAP